MIKNEYSPITLIGSKAIINRYLILNEILERRNKISISLGFKRIRSSKKKKSIFDII